MKDYTPNIATAQRLIAKFGRPVILRNEDQTPVDEERPWGPDLDTGDLSLSTFGVFVPPNQVRIFGLSALGDATEFRDMVTFSEQIMICSPGEVDAKSFDIVIDAGVHWRINGIQILKPGTQTVLCYFGIRR